MAGLFDFEHYYKEKMIKTDIKLDVSNIPLKNSPSSLATNDDGSIDEVDMNELVTNNVMYRVTALLTDNQGYLGVDDRVVISVADDTGYVTPLYTALGYSLDDFVSAGIFTIPESRAAIIPFSISVGMMVNGYTIAGIVRCSGNKSDNEGTPIGVLNITVTPRVRLMNSNHAFSQNPYDFDINTQDQNFSHQIGGQTYQPQYTAAALAATGLMGGSMYKGFKWLNKQFNGNSRAVYGYDSFMKMINSLGEVAKENNIGIKTVFYDDSYADPMDWPDGMSERVYNALKITKDWTRTGIKSNAKMKDVYPENYLLDFANKCWSRPDSPLPYIAGDQATALIPNVSDVFKKLYTPAEELAQDFSDKYIDTYKEIMSIRGVRSFMSSGLKKKLKNNQYKLKQFAQGKAYALDLASCTNFLKAMFTSNEHVLMYGLFETSDPLAAWTSGVRLFSTSGFENVYAIGTYNRTSIGTTARDNTSPVYIAVSHKDFNSFDRNAINSLDAWWDGRLHDMMGYPEYIDWEMSVQKKVPITEIKERLAEIYAGVYNDYYDLDEGYPGYITCTYADSKFNVVAYNSSGRSFELTIKDHAANESNEVWSPSDILSVIDSDGVTDNPDQLQLRFGGSVRQFVDIALLVIKALYARVETYSGPDNQPYYFNGSALRPPLADACKYCTAGTYTDDNETIDAVIDWDSSSMPGKVISERKFEPAYVCMDNVGESTTYTINDCIDFTDTMGDAIDEIDDILSAQGIFMGPAFYLLQKTRLNDAKDYYSDLEAIINRIKWYQTFTNESVFDNKTFIGHRVSYEYGPFEYNDDLDNYQVCPFVFMPARFLLPVNMYKRVRVKYKRFGRTRHKTVKRSIGVRWCEVTFVDNDVYEAYPQDSSEPRQFYPIGKTASVQSNSGGTVTFVFDTPIEGDTENTIDIGKVTAFNHGELLLINNDGPEIAVSYNDARVFVSSDEVSGLSGSVYVVGIYVPLENTAKSDARTKIRLEYNMPYIPYDSELRRWAFMNYGAFDQSKYASETRETPADPDTKIPGWVIFKSSSKRIGDMRASMGIYDAVSILVGILRNSYGASSVELVETMRSKDDQELMSSGGGESTFLSWHNYGLAVKILINDKSTGMPIEDGSPEFMKLIDIAEGFTKACENGAFGKPLNVVWCGRLKIGANIFVWEFLPIGVDHKDAVKFREATLNQEDPVASIGYVDVDAAGLVYRVRPRDKVPYILKTSTAYQNAKIINGHHYVSPKYIRNYTVPHDIVLKNVLEFCNLIRTKMQANGSSLNDRENLYEWKSLNERAYKQLLLYYGLTGSITAARALVCGDYVETYKDVVDRKYSENMVEMVRDYLGNLYTDAKIFIEESADGGAWLTLSDGKLHIKTTDIRPTFDQNSKDDFYGEKLAPVECTERGLYIDGVFRTEAELENMGYQIETISENSFIEGYKDGLAVRDDALYLHTLVATQIKEEFDSIKDTFENYGGGIMYDHFVDGPNASMADMLENEFGLIAGQDLIGFDELRAIFNQKNIDDNAGQYSDGTIKGAGGVYGDDVFEKVVSNAELAGVRKASLTKEHITVTVQPSNMSTEDLYKVIMKGTMTQANDMFKK